MKLVVGLGNPGKEYEKTRHNVGFMVLDKVAEKLKVYDFKEKFSGLLGEANYKGEKVLLLKPQTYMNLSGNSIVQVINFYKLNVEEDLIVVYDDMALPLGKLRMREKGSAGGHNGIKSIISHLGDEFLRIKCGIGKSKNDTIDFVLGQFDKIEQEAVDEMIKNASKCALDMVADIELGRIMQKYNKK